MPSPLRNKGVWTISTSQKVPFESEYWPDTCKIEQGMSKAPGLHDIYEEADWKMSTADTPTALRESVTGATRRLFFPTEESASKMAGMIRQDRTHFSLEEGKKMRLPKTILFSIKCQLNGSDYIFITGAYGTRQGPIPLDQVRLPLAVWVAKFEEGRWRLEASLNQHPITQELESGAFSQFGAPSDFGNPAKYKEMIRQAREQFKQSAAATRASTTPPSTQPAPK